jgi:hypothetical protein
MLLPILLAASILPGPQAAMECVDTGADMATTQTRSVRGPNGVTAVLKVSSADDHSKNAHDCDAEYTLVVTPAAGTPVVVDFLASDGEWGRSLSLRLDGFSRDGKRVFGILSEGGKYPSATLFDYDTTGGPVNLIDLKKRFAHVIATGCSATFDVAGTTETGAIVVMLNSGKPCAVSRRWLLNPAESKPRILPPAAPIQDLFNFKDAP